MRSIDVGSYIQNYEGFYEKFTYLMSINIGRMIIIFRVFALSSTRLITLFGQIAFDNFYRYMVVSPSFQTSGLYSKI